MVFAGAGEDVGVGVGCGGEAEVRHGDIVAVVVHAALPAPCFAVRLLAAAAEGLLHELVSFVPVFEAGIFAHESQLDIAYGAASVFGNYELRQSAYVVAILVFGTFCIILGAVYEANDVGILLNGTRFAEVGEHGTLVLAGFGASVKLREGYDGNLELLGEGLERA